MRSSDALNCCIFIAITCLPKASSLSGILERDLFDDTPDASLFSDEPSLGTGDRLDQTDGLTSTGFLADNVLDPLAEPDSAWFLTDKGYMDGSDPSFSLAGDDIVCNVNGDGDTQLLGKVRRGDLCRDPPAGQAQTPNEPDPADPFAAFKKLLDDSTGPLSVFPEDFEICPKRYFAASNIPVCKDLRQGGITYIPMSNAANLWFIEPGSDSCWLLHPT